MYVTLYTTVTVPNSVKTVGVAALQLIRGYSNMEVPMPFDITVIHKAMCD